MAHGRKTVICKSCNQEKIHFGHGMCSACLRNHKRKTKPEFYLGTCYSEITRRCNTYDKKRPNYYGKSKCTKEEFINKFKNNEAFLKQFKIWQDNDFQRRYSPSIDRIDNNNDYTLDNLEFIQHSENSKKDWQNKVRVYTDNFIIEFESQKDAANYLDISPATVCIAIRDNNGYINNRIRIIRE